MFASDLREDKVSTGGRAPVSVLKHSKTKSMAVARMVAEKFGKQMGQSFLPLQEDPEG